jgi:hypothetical protein
MGHNPLAAVYLSEGYYSWLENPVSEGRTGRICAGTLSLLKSGIMG